MCKPKVAGSSLWKAKLGISATAGVHVNLSVCCTPEVFFVVVVLKPAWLIRRDRRKSCVVSLALVGVYL